MIDEQEPEDDKQKQIENEVLFEQALNRSKKDNYLGDLETVRLYLRNQAVKILGMFEVEDNPQELQDALNKVSDQVAETFLGMDADFEEVPGWNEPGKIDEFFKQQMNLLDNNPKEIVKHAFTRLVDEILTIAAYAGEEGVLDEQWTFQVDAILDVYARLFLGQSIESQMSTTLGDKEPLTVEADE